jgi:hypothetical protein
VRRGAFALYASRLVVQECQVGDPQAATDRLAALAGVTLLRQTPESASLAEGPLRGVPLPEQAAADANVVWPQLFRPQLCSEQLRLGPHVRTRESGWQSCLSRKR